MDLNKHVLTLISVPRDVLWFSTWRSHRALRRKLRCSYWDYFASSWTHFHTESCTFLCSPWSYTRTHSISGGNIHVVVALEEVSGFAFAKLGVAKFAGRGGSAKGEVGSLFVAVCNALIWVDELIKTMGLIRKGKRGTYVELVSAPYIFKVLDFNYSIIIQLVFLRL